MDDADAERNPEVSALEIQAAAEKTLSTAR
jgi:hypothetical protein